MFENAPVQLWVAAPPPPTVSFLANNGRKRLTHTTFTTWMVISSPQSWPKGHHQLHRYLLHYNTKSNILYPVNSLNYLFRMHQTKSITISIIGLASLFYWFFSISLKKSTQSGPEPEISGLQDPGTNHYITEIDGDVSLLFPDLWSHSNRSSSIASLHLFHHVLTTRCVSCPPPEWPDPFREIGRFMEQFHALINLYTEGPDA